MTEKTYELMVCGWNGNPRHCVYLNDYRIAGSKPWGGSTEARAWQVTLKDLTEAIPELRDLLTGGVMAPETVGPEPVDSHEQADAETTVRTKTLPRSTSNG